jgi:predicted alpha/beta-hydrolase family hydrolase
MQAWARRLETLGEVFPFDYPYQQARQRRPDPLPRLIAAHREVISRARAAGEGPLVLAGKSMGSRVGCHASLEDPVDALICFGYPLKSASSGALRDQVLLELRTPILFLQGTRDTLCPLDVLASVRPRMIARNELHVVEGGDHSLTVFKRQSQEDADAAVLARVDAFLRETAGAAH